VQGWRVGGEQRRHADVPLSRSPSGQTGTVGTAGHRDIQERRVRTASGIPSHRRQATNHMGPRPGVHLHTANHVWRGLVGTRARRIRRKRGRYVGLAGNRVHVSGGSVANGADGRGLPTVRAGRGAHHAEMGGERDAQTVADAESDGEQ